MPSYQVTVLALSKLQQDAFIQAEESHIESTKEAWRQAMIAKSPTYQYWDTVLQMEIKHHEEGFCSQKTFKEQAINLIQSINEMGNPFLDGTNELLMLDT